VWVKAEGMKKAAQEGAAEGACSPEV